MERQKSGKKALKLVLLLFLAAGIAVSLLPCGASSAWRTVFSFFGLEDFSAAAQGAPFSMHVLNVGKADSILLECSGRFMLVDGGTFDRGEPVSEYLSRQGVSQLDCVVNTHPDDDHIGGLDTVLRRFPVKRYLAPKLPQKLIPSSEEYLAVQDALQSENLKTEHPSSGQTFSLGSAKIQVLGPIKQGESTNNNSIVLRVVFGRTSFLLMGDAETEEENDLLASNLPLASTVLKVGHHGSGTSSSAAFLNAVRPRYAAVSVADDSSHLPKRDTLLRLAGVGAKIYRTDVSGTLIFLSDGKNVSVATEKGNMDSSEGDSENKLS